MSVSIGDIYNPDGSYNKDWGDEIYKYIETLNKYGDTLPKESHFNDPNVTRGIRNNNPGNLIKTNQAWQGKIKPGSDPKFEQFYTMEFGIRAMFIDIIGDIVNKNLNTLTKLIHEYAPPHENNTTNYINIVAKKVGIEPNDPLPLTDNFLVSLVRAKLEVENGKDANLVSNAQIKKGLSIINNSAIANLEKGRNTPGFTTEYTAGIFSNPYLKYGLILLGGYVTIKLIKNRI